MRKKTIPAVATKLKCTWKLPSPSAFFPLDPQYHTQSPRRSFASSLFPSFSLSVSSLQESGKHSSWARRRRRRREERQILAPIFFRASEAPKIRTPLPNVETSQKNHKHLPIYYNLWQQKSKQQYNLILWFYFFWRSKKWNHCKL